jgi:hypothetical protein
VAQHRDGGLVWEWWGRTLPPGQRAMGSGAYCVCADRLGDVFQLLTAILEANVQLSFDFAVHFLRNQDVARVSDPLEPNSNIDPVSVEVTVLPNNNVAKIEPDRQARRGTPVLANWNVTLTIPGDSFCQ